VAQVSFAGRLTERVYVESEIPSCHASKREIENGLTEALLGLPGEWRVEILCSRSDTWWMLRVDGPRFTWTVVLTDPAERSAPEMTRCLLQALRERKVLS
jgi:hypothetical protein